MTHRSEAIELQLDLPGSDSESVGEVEQWQAVTQPVDDAPGRKPVDPLEYGDALDVYLRDVGRYRLLTAEEEVSLAKQIESGAEAIRHLAPERRLPPAKKRALQRRCREGEAARETMVRANLRLVISIARRYRLTGIPLVDLIQEGNLGLMRAVEKFDWRRGLKFSTYATWWIRQAVQRGVADRGRTIRLPVHVHEALFRIKRAQADLEAEQGREATVSEVAENARLTPERVRELRSVASATLSLETPVNRESETVLRDLIPDESATEQFDLALSDAGREEILEVLNTLDERERRILELRFGLTNQEPRTLEEVGERFGLTRERIRQIEQLALAKLRHPSRSSAFRTEA